MKSIFKPVLVAVLLAGAGFVAVTQVQAAGEPGGMFPGMHGGAGHHMGSSDQMNPAKIQARHNKHMAALKAKLKLSATQESAWTTFTAAMQPPAKAMGQRPDMTELSKLPTPERIDKMKALHAEHMTAMNAEMNQRGDAAKSFYATLSEDQKKVFDAEAMPRMGRGGRSGGHHGGMPKQP
jgi:hypothetical protein